jgi:hypothetical protein
MGTYSKLLTLFCIIVFSMIFWDSKNAGMNWFCIVYGKAVD